VRGLQLKEKRLSLLLVSLESLFGLLTASLGMSDIVFRLIHFGERGLALMLLSGFGFLLGNEGQGSGVVDDG